MSNKVNASIKTITSWTCPSCGTRHAENCAASKNDELTCRHCLESYIIDEVTNS